MNQADFYKSFTFNIFKINRYHLTDNSKTPVPHHFFGCLIKGTAKIKAKNREINLRPGEIFYIPKGLKYQSQWFGENGKEVKFYSFGFKYLPSGKSFELQKISCSKKAQEFFNELCNHVPVTPKGVGALYSFFGEVEGDMVEADVSAVNPTVEKAMEFLRENPDMHVSRLARLCNVSESGIYLLFKRELNKTPNQVRLEFLCQRAVSLLTTTNKSVQEISDTLGFSSTSYFRKILKANSGKTPLQIRKESEF